MWKFEVLIVLTLLTVLDVYADVVKLSNGCVWNNTELEKPTISWFSLPFPLLNCSHLGLTKINFTGVPNTTASIDLSYNELTTIKATDFAKFASLERVQLKQNKLVDLIPSEDVRLPSVHYITLSHNKLLEVPHEWLKSFPKLQTLSLYSNKISIIKSNYFEDNNELKYLALGPNPIKNFESDWLEHVNLTSLTLDGMNLLTIPSKLSKMSTLMHLSMTGNGLTQIPDNSFKECKSIKWLQFSDNKISKISSKAFSGMFALTLLDLSDNKISTIPAGTFDNMKKERVEVSLFENPLNCSCNLQWFKRWADQLESEDLSTDIRYKCDQPLRNHGKKAYELTVADFSCSTDDETWIDCNKPALTTTLAPPKEDLTCPGQCVCYNRDGIQYHPPVGEGESQIAMPTRSRHYEPPYPLPLVNCENTGLNSMPQVSEDVATLLLGLNKIKKVNLEMFRNFNSLEILDLDDNDINTILPSSKTILPKVYELNIRSNLISNISVAHLASFPNLKTLQMYDNKITTLDRNIFNKNRELRRLWIGPNPLEKFDSECLRNMKNLILLDLRRINLTSVPSTMRNLTKLVYVDLSDNRITEVNNFSFSSALSYLKLDDNLISKVASKAFKGATSLRSLDLSENKIETLPKDVFNDLNTERLRIELWQNPISCNCCMSWFKSWIEEMNRENPMTEVKFACYHPERVHGNHSDTMNPNDFICSDDDEYGDDDESTDSEAMIGYSHGQMALAILLSMLFTFLLTAVCFRCCCGAGRNKRVRYSQHANSTTQLDLDMD